MNFKKFLKKVEGDSRKILKKIWRQKIPRRCILGGGLAVLLLAGAFFSFNLAYQNKIFPRTFIGGTNFGGLNKAEARNKLGDLISKNSNQNMSFVWQDKTYKASLEDLETNYKIREEETLNELFAVGRVGGLSEIIKENFKAVFGKNMIGAKFGISDAKLNDYLMNIAKDIDKSEKDATIEIRGQEPVVVAEEIGQKFEVSDNRNIVLNFIASFTFPEPMPFRISKIMPKIDSNGAEAAIPETLELMKRQLVLHGANKTFELHSEDVTSMIEFVARLNQKSVLDLKKDPKISLYVLSPEIGSSKVYPFVEKISDEVYQEPKDPEFRAGGGRVTAFQLAQTGYELDKEKAVEQIIDALKKGESSLELPIKVTEPTVSSDDPEKLGLKELIGEGKTSWRGSPPNRIYNLKLGTKKISGAIVKPGEEFSTLKAIGPVDGANGWLKELVIKNKNQVSPEYGGGLCQVSSTLFRAILNSGLKITQRTAHSFRVSYYEPPIGMDATIYDPSPDLRFINNMSTPVFIWGIADSNTLTFQIYGTKDGRKVEISEPVVGGYTSASEPIYTESDTLGPGEIRQVERSTPGATASFTYKVTSAIGEVLQSETYVSKYVPIPNSYLYGPGTTGIPGQEDDSSGGQAPPAEATPAPTPTVESTTKTGR